MHATPRLFVVAALCVLPACAGATQPTPAAPSAPTAAPPQAARFAAPPRPTAPRFAAVTPAQRAVAGDWRTAFRQKDVPFEQMVAESRRRGRPAVLFLYGDWCGYCRKLQREALSQTSVQARLRDFPTACFDSETPGGRAVIDRFGVTGFPTTILVDGNGREVHRIVGARDPARYLAELAPF